MMKKPIIFSLLFLYSCSYNKQFDDFLIRQNLTIFWYINEYAEKGINNHSNLTWSDLNFNLNNTNVTGVHDNRDVSEYLIVERSHRKYYLQTSYWPNRIILKKNNKLYFFGYESSTIKSNRIIDYKAELLLYNSLVKSLENNDSVVVYGIFKRELIKHNVIKEKDIFVLTNPRKDSLEFFYTTKGNSEIVRWYYEKNAYFHSSLHLVDSIVIPR
jgi:hypothetical protein